MLSRNMMRVSQMLKSRSIVNPRLFSTGGVGVADMPDVFKVNYTEEFDQGLTEEEKSKMKRFDIYRSDPSNPNDRPKYVSYYIDT